MSALFITVCPISSKSTSKNQPIIGLRELASRETVLICINGPGCHHWFGLVAGIALLSFPTRRLTLAASLLVATGVSRLYQSIT